MKRETLKEKIKKLEKAHSEHWINHTVEEVAKLEGVSLLTARAWMKKHKIKPDTEIKRKSKERRHLWKGLSANEIQETLEPGMSVENIRAYARNHKIKLKSKGRGRPSGIKTIKINLT